MPEADLLRQIDLYLALLRGSPYSARVTLTSLDGAGVIRYGEEMKELERERHALTQGAKLHPQYPQEFDGRSFSVAWQNIPQNLGGWAAWSEEARARLYPVLNRPDGPFHLAGEHLTYLGGWMAGAFESAKATVAAVHERMATAG